MKLFQKSNILFFICFIIIIKLYHFFPVLSLKPQSMHLWRQTDCLSIAKNYYENGMNFFKPEIHNQLGDNGTSGYSAGELPLLYYMAAVLWKMFGVHEWIYRLLVLVISFAGFFALFKTLSGLLKDSFWGAIGAFLVFTSPILAYYSANFLTNLPALSFSFIGWYYFYKYYENKQEKFFIVSTAFFALAALLKIPESLNYLIIVFFYLIETGTGFFRKHQVSFFPHPKKSLLSILLFFALVFSWYIYAKYFNDAHNGKYTFNDIWPIWRMTPDQIKNVYEFVTKIMMYQIYHNSVFYLMILALLIFILNYKKINRFFLAITLLFFFGSCAYLILWFNALDAHDYYLINLFIFPALIFVTLMLFVQKEYSFLFESKKLKIAASLFLLLNILYCSANIKMRYWLGENNTQFFATDYEKGYWWYTNDHYKAQIEALNTIEDYNRTLNISKNDKVICMPDPSINISLYLMNQKGFTDYGFNEYQGADRMRFAIKNGAKYLFVLNEETLKQEYLQEFTKNKIGEYKNIKIFDLRNIAYVR